MDIPELPCLRGMQQPLRLRADDPVDHWSIGDEVAGPAGGIVVDIQDDAVVVARRNASGRYMEIVFVGEAIRTLRPA